MCESNYGCLAGRYIVLCACSLLLYCVTRRELQVPGTAEEDKRQETPIINPIDRPPTHLIDQAPITIERAAQETHNTY